MRRRIGIKMLIWKPGYLVNLRMGKRLNITVLRNLRGSVSKITQAQVARIITKSFLTELAKYRNRKIIKPINSGIKSGETTKCVSCQMVGAPNNSKYLVIPAPAELR